MTDPLHVLIVEDSEDDARLLHRKLELAGYALTSEQVDSGPAMRAALDRGPWDLILCDYVMPGFGGLEALAIARERHAQLPFIVVSGKIDEETAVAAMKAGASDFISKAHLERLIPAVKRELAAAEARHRASLAHLEWQTVLDSVQDAMFVHDAGHRILRCNRAYAALAGMRVDEVIGKRYWEVFPRAEGPLAGCRASRESGIQGEEDLALPDGRRFVSRTFPVADAAGGFLYELHLLRDVTERTRAELGLRLFRNLIDRSTDAIEVIDPATLRYLDVNEQACRQLGYSREELLAMSVPDVDPVGASETQARRLDDALRTSGSVVIESVHRRKDGTTFPVEVSISAVRLDRDYGIAIARDITERKRAQQALEIERTVLATMQETSPDATLLIDERAHIVSYNHQFLELWSIPDELVKTGADEPVLRHVTRQMQDPEGFLAKVRELYGHRELRSYDELRLRDGRTVERHSAPVIGPTGLYFGRVWYFRDVTGRKRSEHELKRLNWALRALGLSNSALVHAGSEEELFRRCCEAITSAGGYRLAWIGLARDDPGRTVEVAAAAGEALGYMDGLQVSWGETPLGKGPTGTAIRTGAAQVLDDFEASGMFAPWLERARRHGLASSITLPIRADGGAHGALMVYSHEANAFGKAEIELFEELASDIGYGLVARRTRAAYDASVSERTAQALKLRATFEAAIAALAATVEQRDPYTAGHQRRVAELAVAIAREIGMDEERLEGLRVASTIHDIGKISVPAEILSRPGRLTRAEFEIVKNHAQMGYDIVKGVDFPWRLADTIWQHHERLDGSGYPRGLKGEEILPEARVLAVADVVEAFASHRPYRPAAGLGPALEHIAAEAGRLYDPRVVAACLRVFREKGYRLPD